MVAINSTSAKYSICTTFTVNWMLSVSKTYLCVSISQHVWNKYKPGATVRSHSEGDPIVLENVYMWLKSAEAVLLWSLISCMSKQWHFSEMQLTSTEKLRTLDNTKTIHQRPLDSLCRAQASTANCRPAICKYKTFTRCFGLADERLWAICPDMD